jgi:hypothetical protein
MSNIKYVIRHNDFAYNDEWYITDEASLGAIKATYDNKLEAEEAYKKLVVHALYNDQELSQYDIGNGYASEELYAKIEAFILEKTGEEFDNEELPEMTDDDAFEFAKLSGILCYQLIEVDDSKPNYAIWMLQSEEYLRGDYSSGFFNSQDDSFSDIDWPQEMHQFEDEFDENIVNQPFATLSDSPELLKSFIQSVEAITSDEQSITSIDYEGLSFIQLKALNALLKEPLFEIRALTLEQIQAL